MRAPALRWWAGHPPTDPLPPAGSRYAAFCIRCCPPGAAQSRPFPSPLLPLLCQPGASITALKPALASAMAPLQLNWTSSHLPAASAEANAAAAGSRKQWRSSQALGCRQAWAATYFSPRLRVAHFADHLQCRANSVLNPTISLPSSHSLA